MPPSNSIQTNKINHGKLTYIDGKLKQFIAVVSEDRASGIVQTESLSCRLLLLNGPPRLRDTRLVEALGQTSTTNHKQPYN